MDMPRVVVVGHWAFVNHESPLTEAFLVGITWGDTIELDTPSGYLSSHFSTTRDHHQTNVKLRKQKSNETKQEAMAPTLASNVEMC